MRDHTSMLDITDLGPEGLASVVDLALRPVGDLGLPL